MEDLEYIEKEEAEEAREALREYYGTAVSNGFPMAMMDLVKVDSKSDEEVIREARKNGLL